jgi:hypothetical protein
MTINIAKIGRQSVKRGVVRVFFMGGLSQLTDFGGLPALSLASITAKLGKLGA